MKRSVIALIIFFFYSSLLISQDKEIINKYRPTENDLYKTLDQGIRSKTVKHIKMMYNEKGCYSYTQKKTFNGKGKTVIFEFYGEKPGINFTLKNLSLSNFDKVLFNLFNVSNVIIDSCSFENIMQGIKFEFKETANRSCDESKIIIKHCQFDDDNLYKDKVNNYFQLQFQKNAYAKGLAKLKNVTIENCEFEMSDSNKSWLIKSAYNVYPKRHSIDFQRNDINTAFSNIIIRDNNFEACAPFYRTEAITLGNISGGNFMTHKKHYENNHNITITGNTMSTNSEDPGHGIFIQGPYKTVNITSNKVYNYGMSINDGKAIHCDGAVHLYGARNAKYSDNFIDVKVSNNIIDGVGLALKISGGSNIKVQDNKIKMMPWPKFYKNSELLAHSDRIGIRIETGAYSISGKQNININVSNNTINCNYEDECFGILVQGTKNFMVKNNKIHDPTNYGILIYGHRGESQLGIGQSVIESNSIDYGNLDVKSLNTKFYNDVNFAAIKVHRMDNGEEYENESLEIRDNHIIDKSNTIPKVSIVDKTNSQLRKNTKSDIQIEN